LGSLGTKGKSQRRKVSIWLVTGGHDISRTANKQQGRKGASNTDFLLEVDIGREGEEPWRGNWEAQPLGKESLGAP
jgi:hypothetical protein